MARSVGRPKEPALTRGGVITAALAIIDRDGLEGLNIRALGEAIGVNSASLYHHFANKDEILLGVARSVLRNVQMRERPGEPWQSWMVVALIELRRALLAHPKAVPLILELHPRSFAPEPYNHAGEVLEQNGVPAGMTLTILDALEGLAFGSALNAMYAASRGGTTPGEPEGADARWAGLSRMYDTSTYDDEQRFEMACYALISGLTTELARRQATDRVVKGAVRAR